MESFHTYTHIHIMEISNEQRAKTFL